MGLCIAPFAFMEHVVLMLSSVLKSEKAVQVNILITDHFGDPLNLKIYQHNLQAS